MKNAVLKAIVLGVLNAGALFAHGNLPRVVPEQILQVTYIGIGYPFLWANTSLKEATYNLDRYKMYFNDPTLPQATGSSQGYVDKNSNYVGLGSTLITDKKTIKKILKNFQALPSIYGWFNLNAYAGKFDSKSLSEIVFVDSLGRYAIRGGEVITLDGQYLTFAAADQNIHEDWANFLYHSAKKAAAFVQGDSSAPQELYVNGLPDDSVTNAFYNQILPYVNSGQVKIYWSLGSYINSSNLASRGKVFAIYEGIVPPEFSYPPTPAGAWAFNEDNFDSSTGQGAILPIVNPQKKTIELANAGLEFNATYANESLLICYKTKCGVYDYQKDVPSDMDAFLSNVYSR